MSASVFGRSVPRQIVLARCLGFSSSLSRSLVLGAFARRSTGPRPSGGAGGGSVVRIVHGLLTIGSISGYSRDSSRVGIHVRPSGGPKMAQEDSFAAMSLVVNLASRDGNPQIGGVVNAS